MGKQLVRLMIAVALVVIGWSVGRAQTTAPDFELVVTKHDGGMDMQVACKKGCTLGYINPQGVARKLVGRNDVGFACGNEARCDFTFAGWSQR